MFLNIIIFENCTWAVLDVSGYYNFEKYTRTWAILDVSWYYYFEKYTWMFLDYYFDCCTWAVLDVSGYSMMFQTVVLILPILNINQPWVKLQIGLGNTIKKNLFTLVFKQVNRKQTAVYRLYLMKKPLQSVYLTHFLKLKHLRLLLLNLS